jgi:hypothetical protein
MVKLSVLVCLFDDFDFSTLLPVRSTSFDQLQELFTADDSNVIASPIYNYI